MKKLYLLKNKFFAKILSHFELCLQIRMYSLIPLFHLQLSAKTIFFSSPACLAMSQIFPVICQTYTFVLSIMNFVRLRSYEFLSCNIKLGWKKVWVLGVVIWTCTPPHAFGGGGWNVEREKEQLKFHLFYLPSKSPRSTYFSPIR